MKAAVVMWWDVAPEIRAEWEHWHTVEHMPERLAIPGFLRGTRYVALSGEPSYFVLYEAASLDVITSGPYLERLNNPTPWSRRMMPHHLNMVRCLCEVRAGWGGGVPSVMATVRLSDEAKNLAKGKGLSSAYSLQARAGPPQTTEQKIRGGEATANWALLIGGYDEQAVKSAAAGMAAGFYRPAYSLSSGELAS